MAEILLVEDAKFFRTVLKSQIEGSFGYNVTAVETYGEAVKELTSRQNHYDLALLDLNLPDAPDGEIVDVVSGMSIPSIIFSGSFSEEIRDLLERPNIIDYVVKDSPASLNYVLNTVDRYFKNNHCKVLVVDDSRVARKHMVALLRQFNFNVFSAENGQEALKVFNEHGDIRLVITDYNMPDMQGVDVCKRIRAKKNRDEVCIIGVSAYGTHAISAQFLKAGASDFLVKPFLTEEFFCRVTLNMDALDKVHELDELVYTDLVTQLKNRRYLEAKYKRIYKRARELELNLVCAFFELDDFKEFNDKYGSDAGDAILFMLAREFEKTFKSSGLTTRYGGSQFCLLGTTDNLDDYMEHIQNAHNMLTQKTFNFADQELNISFTTCVCSLKDIASADILAKTKSAINDAKKTLKGHFLRAD
ncbi:putative Response regulator receiver modulated diguanylate cyclase [Candidatus Terasakiella magnetica]|uniref:Putative Response regulator receiver modulated diguanylate cyclase n=1 Tax=Candidatus Terasakiella magnetica TaxID=1867952 RepID=A0A1C3RIX8_9PROT|nr:response regulator [Candidatus Terasakiella magnetica]SCA57208.1 putative Response regulator receiver modulated diguanylate cyclase [Candidatus Terasakiella magnetica]